jgi:hypothetical protein
VKKMAFITRYLLHLNIILSFISHHVIPMEIKHEVRIKTRKCNQTTKKPGENLAIWLNALKIEKMLRPWGKNLLRVKKTLGCKNRLKIPTPGVWAIQL